MKRIVLAKLEDASQHQLYPPFGLMYLSNALKQAGYDAEIFHKYGTKENIKQLINKSRGSLFVGFSVMTSSSLKYNLIASRQIHNLGIPVVWGGVHATMIPELTLKDDFIDYAVLGEGEEVIVNLAEHFEKRNKIDKINGLAYRKNGKIIVKPQQKFIDINKYRLDWSSLDINTYFQSRKGYNKTLPFLTSRGCPHRCEFCYNVAVNKRRWRAQDEKIVLEELKKIKSFNPDAIYFYDDNLFTNKARAFSIVSKLGLPWMADARADYFDEDFVKTAKSYGCEELFVGAESGSQKILKLICKDITLEQIENAVKLCQKYDIRCTLSFITGFPTETLDDVKKTMNFMYVLHNKYDSANLEGPKIYTPYPGTPLYNLTLRYGFNEPKSSYQWGEDLSRYKCNLPWVKNKKNLEVLYLISQLSQMHPHYILPSILKSIEEFRWRNCLINSLPELRFISKLKSRWLVKLFFKLKER